MLSYLSGMTPGVRGLQRMKPGLMFLLRLAWESRTRLPLLIMSGFMALGVRIQLEINIDRAVQFMPRLRLEEDEDEDEDDDDDDEEDDEDEYDEVDELVLSEADTSGTWSNDYEDYELDFSHDESFEVFFANNKLEDSLSVADK